MQTRSFVVAIALVLALAVAAPTIGATNTRGVVAENALDIAKQSREIAKTAKRAAGKARGIAQSALTTANTASTAATAAANKADAASADAAAASSKADAASTAAGAASAKADAVAADLNATKSKSQSLAGSVTTANETDYQDLGGPSVTVTVPASGLIEVWATVDAEEGAISLFEDGNQVPDLDPNFVCDGPNGALLSVPGSPDAVVSTANAVPFGGLCGQPGPATAILLHVTPGPHTYSLRYADCGCDPGVDGTFSDRSLTVAPRL
jgi:hypothetical protein